MHHLSADTQQANNNDYLVSKSRAWFAFAMTFALMLFDYIDRQVIVSLFPHLKAAWNLSDKQLGGLVSIISVVVALGGIPVALLADRVSRVKSVVVMGVVWSLATISCMFTRNYSQLFMARAAVARRLRCRTGRAASAASARRRGRHRPPCRDAVPPRAGNSASPRPPDAAIRPRRPCACG